MRNCLRIALRALMIVIVASLIGAFVNVVSPYRIPWKYVKRQEITVEKVKIPLVDEKTAFKKFSSEGALFVDTRAEDDYFEGHVKGAVLLPEKEMEERFPAVEPLLEPDGLLILYCHGPECHMAEKVAGFLIQLGFKRLMIMTAGFPAWEQAGFPVEGEAVK
jgi:rhodanese-related sulfurtransferase